MPPIIIGASASSSVPDTVLLDAQAAPRIIPLLQQRLSGGLHLTPECIVVSIYRGLKCCPVLNYLEWKFGLAPLTKRALHYCGACGLGSVLPRSIRVCFPFQKQLNNLDGICISCRLKIIQTGLESALYSRHSFTILVEAVFTAS